MGSEAVKKSEIVAFAGTDMERIEIIRDEVYTMAPPSWSHDQVVRFINYQLTTHFLHTDCNVAVGSGLKLEGDKTWEEAYVIPDLMVVCSSDKIAELGLESPPSLIVEVVSRSNSSN